MYCSNNGNILKSIRTILPSVQPHWVGDGFLVKPGLFITVIHHALITDYLYTHQYLPMLHLHQRFLLF